MCSLQCSKLANDFLGILACIYLAVQWRDMEAYNSTHFAVIPGWSFNEYSHEVNFVISKVSLIKIAGYICLNQLGNNDELNDSLQENVKC